MNGSKSVIYLQLTDTRWWNMECYEEFVADYTL
jgi:hypothetical protein